MAKERKVNGVVLAATNQVVLDSSLASFSLGGGGQVDSKVLRLSEHLDKVIDKKNTIRCDKCGGLADLSFPRCPYCGESGLQDSGPQKDWRTIEVHPAALLFPLPTEEEQASLFESISNHGYDRNHPIILCCRQFQKQNTSRDSRSK